MEDKTIDLNLIPFGLNPKDGKFLDVADVPRGKKCGCICPSCKTPLIARHGEVKEWHFAHASRSVYTKTENECAFSFFLSARLMARQIIESQLEICLPAYKDCLVEYDPRYEQRIRVPFTIAAPQRITLSNIEVEQRFLGAPVDMFGHIGEFAFIVYFTHPGREIPPEFFNSSDLKCGIIAVSLDHLPTLFKKARKSGVAYLTALRDFLVNDIASKRWVFHPRYKSSKEKAKHAIKEQMALMPTRHIKLIHEPLASVDTTTTPAPEKPNNDTPFTPPNRKPAIFKCIMCHTTWQDWEPSGSVCPKCNTHLYRTLKGYVNG